MTIRNTTAVWGWLICSAFIFGCAGMSWLLLNERVPEGTSAALMGAFNLAMWAVGMFAAQRVFAKPVTILRCHVEGITVDSYWLWKRVRTYYAKDCIRATRIQESADSEGDPYFTASVVLSNGTTILLAEGHFRELCEKALVRLNRALHSADSTAAPHCRR
jgi:hypothetical protein